MGRSSTVFFLYAFIAARGVSGFIIPIPIGFVIFPPNGGIENVAALLEAEAPLLPSENSLVEKNNSKLLDGADANMAAVFCGGGRLDVTGEAHFFSS